MRNALIMVDEMELEKSRGLDDRVAVTKAAVRRARPVLLTALAAVLAFLPLTQSSFWGSLAIVLLGGTLVGTAITPFFLPALYALWFRVGKTRGKAVQRTPSWPGGNRRAGWALISRQFG